MLSDYFTKPLQGAVFYNFRDRLLNIAPGHTSKPIIGDDLGQRSVLELNIGNPDQSKESVRVKAQKTVKWVDQEAGRLGQVQSLVGDTYNGEWKAVPIRTSRKPVVKRLANLSKGVKDMITKRVNKCRDIK